MKLIVGNKNYSSWSLRPWLLMTHLEIPFEEIALSFNDPNFKARVGQYSPAGKVPVLVDEDLVVWDTLAIAEYLAEKFPQRNLWPKDTAARAYARSICAEMHSSFVAMRTTMSMNCELKLNWMPLDRAVQRDVARVLSIWTHCRTQFGKTGPFLFGEFTAADAYFAPVVRRFLGFSVELPELCAQYVATIDTLPAMRKWVEAALREHDFVVVDEIYRTRDA